MSYAIVEIEVTEPLPTLSLSGEGTGVAVLLRREGRPVGFWMEARPDRRKITPDELACKIGEEAGAPILRESLHREIAPSVPAGRYPSLTVAVCTKDRPAFLRRCLESVKTLPEAAPGGARGPELEVLVVDNAPSDDRTRELADALPGVRYACEPRPGLDFARNRALREATGELVAFLDDDVVVDHGWMKGLLGAWAMHPDAAAFTGLVLPYALDTEAQIIFERRGGFRRGFRQIRYQGQRRIGNPLYPCGAGIFGAGANMAFQREVLMELGGFDEALDTGRPLPGGGDLDIFYRVIRAGYPLVYEPQYLVFHEHRRTRKALRRQYWSWGLGFMAFVAKSYREDPPQRAKLRRLVSWWFGDQLRQLVKSLLGRHQLPARMVAAELRGGLQGLLGEYARSTRRVEAIRKRFA